MEMGNNNMMRMRMTSEQISTKISDALLVIFSADERLWIWVGDDVVN
jgi:hypothetical protein